MSAPINWRRVLWLAVVVVVAWFFWPVIGPVVSFALAAIGEIVAFVWNYAIVPLWDAISNMRSNLR